MKVAIITDSHAGARNDSPLFNEYFISFFEKTFFPYIEKNNIRTVVHLGDIFDRRKYINIATYNEWKMRVFNRLYDTVDRFDILLGNHDCYWKNCNDTNSVDAFFNAYSDTFKIYRTATEIYLDKLKVLYVPWIAADNSEHSLKLIDKSDATICMGHLEINNFQMYPGQYAMHGLSEKLFEKFHSTFSGHFHYKNSRDDIHYLGSPYPMTWADYNTDRGFHIFDTETLELEFIKNEEEIFKKYYYDDSQDLVIDVEESKNKLVKVVVKKKTDNEKFDKYMQNLQQSGASDIAILDEFLDSEIISESFDESSLAVKDTLSILKDCVASIDRENVKKEKVLSVLQEIYIESINENARI